MQKIPVGILGATGMVGQKFIELLSSHPWFEIVALGASDRSAGKYYKDAMQWSMSSPLPEEIALMKVLPCEPPFPCEVLFSGLDSSVAGEIEETFAFAGYSVISNASNHRMDEEVPLLIPEVNPEQLELLKKQSFGKGCLVTNPNCCVIGLALALKPLLEQWDLTSVHVVTMQALSGAGYPGVASLDILDNVIPYIPNEERKIETEPLKIFNRSDILISAQCNRVAVVDGHLACVSIKLKHSASKENIVSAWKHFKGEPQHLELPSAPKHPLIYLDQEKHPQPKLHRFLEKGMAVSIGRLQRCPILDWKFVILSHNTIRGAAGGAILNAELMVKKGVFYRNQACLAASLAK
jgi:aspartate-semialdehyde dehydrogenase